MKGYYPSIGCRDSIIMADGSAGMCKYIGTACPVSPPSHTSLNSPSMSCCHPLLAPNLHGLLCAVLIFLLTQPAPPSHHLSICRSIAGFNPPGLINILHHCCHCALINPLSPSSSFLMSFFLSVLLHRPLESSWGERALLMRCPSASSLSMRGFSP